MPPTSNATEQGFEGLTVAAFESRMAKEMEDLITRHGGVPQVAPSMREIPLTENKAAFNFFETLQQGIFQVTVLMTGVGTKTLLEALEASYPKSHVMKAFKQTSLVARGPKPVKVLSDYGLKATIVVPEPNTWREVLTALEDHQLLKGKCVAVQEYGVSNLEFLKALKSKGVKDVVSVPVYRWALPKDTMPLMSLIQNIMRGGAQVALFTSGNQIHNVFQVAGELGREEELRDAFSKMVVGSIGPVASEALENHGVKPDFEPEHPKMGFLVKEAAAKSQELFKLKSGGKYVPPPPGPMARLKPEEVSVPDQTVEIKGSSKLEPSTKHLAPVTLQDSLFMKACRKAATPRTPLWIMRQAGRYLPQYRAIRSKVSFLDLCKTPELAAEVTVSAQETLDVDAAILFADILLLAEPMGFELEFIENGGPVIHNPFRTAEDLKRLKEVEPAHDLAYVMRAVQLIRAKLKPDIPLIGFAGAPFTLASYMMEGRGSKDYFHTRSMISDVALWDEFMKRLATATAAYLNAQIAAGAQAVQLFDSWVGILTPDEFQRLVLPYLKKLIAALKPGVPVIYFGTQTTPFFPFLKDTGASVIGVDWRVDLDRAWKQLGKVAIQGNLDPSILLTDPATIRQKTLDILKKADRRPGHIFNLGHGILPETPMDNVRAMIDTVKEWKN